MLSHPALEGSRQPWDLPGSGLWQWAARAVSWPGVAHVQPGSGRSPVVNGQVLLLLVGITVPLLAVLRKMPRSGWDGKLNSIVALPVSLLPLSGVQEICLARIHSSISLLLEKKQSKWSLGFLIQSFS